MNSDGRSSSARVFDEMHKLVIYMGCEATHISDHIGACTRPTHGCLWGTSASRRSLICHYDPTIRICYIPASQSHTPPHPTHHTHATRNKIPTGAEGNSEASGSSDPVSEVYEESRGGVVPEIWSN